MGRINLKLKTKKLHEENVNFVVDPIFKQIRKNRTAFLIWRVENLHLVPVPREQYGVFYDGDSYLVYAAFESTKSIQPSTKVKARKIKGRIEMHTHFWLGSQTSQDKSTIAAYKCVELGAYLGGAPVQHREVQGKESARFKGYFKKGVRVLKGGVASGLRHNTDTFEARLFRVQGRNSPKVIQMPSISWEHFSSSGVFILDTRNITFVWIGRNSNNMKKFQAARIGQGVRDEHCGYSLVFVDDGKEADLAEAEKTLFDIYLNPELRTNLKVDLAESDDEENNNSCSEEYTTSGSITADLKLYAEMIRRERTLKNF